MRDDSQIAGSIATHHEERLQRRELQIPPVGRDDKGRVDWNREVCYSDGDKLQVRP